MYGFVIAIMLCSGANCDMLQADPDASYPSVKACNQAMEANSAQLQALADKHLQHGQTSRIVCLHPLNTIVEVEEPHDVMDTAIVHKEPSASALYVGLVEKGKRTLVTGLVAGTDWVRVLLPDGKSGYVYADHLRRVENHPRTASLTARPAPAPVQAASPAPPVRQPQQVPPVHQSQETPPAHQPQAAPPIRQAQPAPSPAPAPAAPVQQAMVIPPPPAPPPPPPRQTGQREFRDCAHCPVMVSLPGGSFEMGSNEDYSERPPHRVTLRPFALGKFEVTVAEWNACGAAGACSYKPPGVAAADSRPVTNLSWSDASQYVQWLRKQTGKPYRLPSESEWEYAAAAGSTAHYSWGDQPGIGKADCRGCGGHYDEHQPTNIGSFPANAWDLHDMLGGVAEWVGDCWHLSYKGAPSDGAAWTDRYCAKHVLRGGSWMNPPSDITVRVRNFYDTSVRYIGNGMRVALSLQ